MRADRDAVCVVAPAPRVSVVCDAWPVVCMRPGRPAMLVAVRVCYYVTLTLWVQGRMWCGVRPAWLGVSIVGGGVSIWCAHSGLRTVQIQSPGPFLYDGAGVMEWRGDVLIYERAGVIVTVGLDMCHRPML